MKIADLAIDQYQVLGVAKTASNKDIVKAFRAISLENHPDRNPSADPETLALKMEVFKKANTAYEILTHSREEYDIGRQAYQARVEEEYESDVPTSGHTSAAPTTTFVARPPIIHDDGLGTARYTGMGEVPSRETERMTSAAKLKEMKEDFELWNREADEIGKALDGGPLDLSAALIF
ncbi:hypothetical protein ONS96_005285 [Cadophora gregata f. sp. sojae]|nr:hypothetical protein ONS96_005285 [Cadophora gregata f. sp. sojae]